MTVDEIFAKFATFQGNLSVIHPEDREQYDQAINVVLGKQSNLDIEYRIVTSTGATRWVHDIAEVEFDANGNPMRSFGTLQDITAQKQSEQALAESAAWAATGRMVARVAHEINNPLAGIKNSFLLLKGGIPADYKYYPYVGRVERELDRISKLIRQLLDQYRPVEPDERDVEFGPAHRRCQTNARTDVSRT